MATISSAQFRKTYPRLREPVTVEVNGHPIGRWLPFDTEAFERERRGLSPDPIPSDYTFGAGSARERFVQFRPAPKPGKKP